MADLCAQERRLVVSHRLPIRAHRNAAETNKWCFDLNDDSLVLQLKDGFPPNVEVLYVGCLEVEIDEADEKEVEGLLLEKFQCVPIFLSSEIQDKFYHGFCKHYLWLLFHDMLPMSLTPGVCFNWSQWKAYESANKAFADKIIALINPDMDYVWVHDYHLISLPTFLRKQVHHVKLGFFLHSPFPTFEIYRTSPVRDEILRGLLDCDIIGFHTYEYATHFLSCCSKILGLNSQTNQGYIGLSCSGRKVRIKILPVGIHVDQLESIMSLPATAEKIQLLKEQFNGNFVMLGVDDLDVFKGLSLKFLAMGKLLEEYPKLIGRVVLVQIVNPPRSQGQDVQEVKNGIDNIAKEINQMYGNHEYMPIILINGPIKTQEKIAYYAISECCVVSAVKDGMNLVPHTYTVCRQCSPSLGNALESRMSVSVVSEFIGCSSYLSQAIRVNPWNIASLSEAMYQAITMGEKERQSRHEKHQKYVISHNVVYWARSFDQDLVRACEEHYHIKLPVLNQIVSSYRNTKSRLILLSYDETRAPLDLMDEVIPNLNWLCNDPKNNVFIVSSRGKESLIRAFVPDKKLGISAEHDYFTRDSPLDLATTDGCFTEKKENALPLHYPEADPDFETFQVVSEGKVLENAISTMQSRGKKLPDFVLCLGNASSDEDNESMTSMPAAIAQLSSTYYYLDDTVEVIGLLQGLASYCFI